MSEHEIMFGTPEHIAGLSRRALEEDFRWVQDRRMELEDECERLDAENAKLRELVQELYERAWFEYPLAFERVFLGRIRELGIEVNP